MTTAGVRNGTHLEAKPGDKTFFFDRYTMWINQREGAKAAEAKFRKSRTTRGNIHWTHLRRRLGVMGLTKAREEPP